MSNKSEATWHPNSGPVTDHTDLIARLKGCDELIDSDPVVLRDLAYEAAAALTQDHAEVKAQALIEAAREYECRNQWTPTLYTRTWLEDRAAAMRAEAE
jgi:hypothetical protein